MYRSDKIVKRRMTAGEVPF